MKTSVVIIEMKTCNLLEYNLNAKLLVVAEETSWTRVISPQEMNVFGDP